MNELLKIEVNDNQEQTIYPLEGKGEPFDKIALTTVGGKLKTVEIAGTKYSVFDCLATAVEAGERGDYELAKAMLDIVECGFAEYSDESLLTVAQAVREVVLFNKIRDKREENLYPVISKHIKKLLGDDAEIIDKKNIGGNFPDLWVRIKDEEIPVEVKRHDFNLKAFKQLKRYMNVYQAKYGIAIGSRLTTPMPPNITFIPIEKIRTIDDGVM